MVDTKIKIALGLIAIMILAAPIAIAQEVPPHVVISEVQIATNEFVELYNPTNSAIYMADWHWCYFSPTRNWNESYRDKPFPPGAIIQAHGFYLIGLKGFPEPSSDWQVYNSTQLADSGSVGIFPWDPDTKTAEEAKAGKIDAVGWGSVTYVYETATASTPNSGKSIERKSLDDDYAPCQDTDDNSLDFVVQDTPTPKNSLSPEMEPAPVELFDVDDNFIGGFINIQDAVDNADDGYTIRVDDGTYEENLDVNMPLTICSEHGAAFTTVSALDSNDHVIDVTADHVTISGFNWAGATQKAGIYLNTAEYCTISNNSASDNNIGIQLQMASRYNAIRNNYVSENKNGIWLAASDSNTIKNNNVSDNENGISLISSNYNHIYNNYFNNTNNAVDDGNNIWNITKIDGTNIICGPYLGGNYWSDYTGADTDNDGLGDSLYDSSDNIENGGDSHPLVRLGTPSFSIVKSGEPDHMHPGGTINYTICVNNTGDGTATNVIVTVTYDANVTFESADPIPSHDDNTWDLYTLIVNETRWINISVTVNPGTPSGTVLHNRVEVTCKEGVSDYATEDTVVGCVESLLGPACFEANHGTIVDLKAVDAPTPYPEGYKFPYGFFSFNITGLSVGQKVNVTITLPVNAPEGTKYWKYHDSEGGWIEIPIIGGSGGDGDKNITFELVDGGLGDDDCEANGVIVDQGGPGGTAPKITYFAPNSPVYDSAGSCRTFNVTVNQAVDVDWYLYDDILQQTNKSVREASCKLCMPVEGVYKVTASAHNMYNPYAPAKQSWIWIVNKTGISVTKVCNVTVAKPSTYVKFNITISNTGKSTLDRIVVEDQLREGLIYSYADPKPNENETGTIPYDIDVTNLTWYFNESLAVNQSKTIELVVEIAETATGVLKNRVDVTGRPETGADVSAHAITEVSVIGLGIKKSCSSSTTSLGKTLTYTITYSNSGGTDLTNVVITENYPDGLTFISADPDPDCGTNNRWTIGTLPAGGSGTITIKMEVPTSTSDLSYTESGSVAGEGIVMISKEISTVQKPYELENIVTISGSYGGTETVSATASAITTVSVSGSSLELTEHGSGTYDSEEELSLSFENGGIYFDKETKAEYRPTTFNCSDGFVMEVPSKWSQDICSKNYATKTAIHKTITEATYMNDNTRIESDNTGYSMDFDSSFLGYLHVGKKTSDAATSEHYIGKFLIKDWDQGGDEIVEGVGYVIIDKELAIVDRVFPTGRLLLMEHGSGSYSSEEDSGKTYIYKTTYAVYEPTQFNFSDSFVVNFSSKWMQDFCTRSTTGTTALHKKIRDATYIDDDTRAKSSPSLTFDTFFYGATHVGSRAKYSRASEDYIGEFYISWGARTDCTFIFDWDDVPGADNDELIRHLSEPRFHMPWVTDADVEITKPANDTINISTPEHSAEIILDTKTNETAELIVAGGETYTFNVEKHGDTLRVYDCELERKPEEVMGEGFVMVDEVILKEGEIQVTEHGSGIYHSDEDFGSTTIEKSTYGEYMPTYFNFADSFSVNLSSKWVQDVCAKDEDEGTAIHKRISDAALMKDDTIVAKRSLDLNSSFNGSMHIGARTENVSISEDYIGEFNVTQVTKIVKEKPSKSSSDTSDWLSCPFPIQASTYLWACQEPTYGARWLSACPYPYGGQWLYLHP